MTRRNIDNARRRAIILEVCGAQQKRQSDADYIAERIEDRKRAQRRANIEAALAARDAESGLRMVTPQ